jgi:hypothetical protein
MQFDRSVGQTQQTMFTMGLLLIVYVPKLILTFILMGEDILELEPELSIILLTMIILPIFLNREENLLVKLDWGLPQYLFLSLIYGLLLNTITRYKATHFLSRFTRGI